MELTTDRLILRPLQEKDACALYPLINDADVAASLLSVPHPYPREVFAPWLRLAKQAFDKRERFEMAVVLKSLGLPVGACSLCEISWEHMTGELGYWLGKKYWGRSIMTEAATRMVQYGFEELGLERIQARCFADNRASARVLEKAGLKYEGCARCEVKKAGKPLDVLHYAIVRADYMADRLGRESAEEPEAVQVS